MPYRVSLTLSLSIDSGLFDLVVFVLNIFTIVMIIIYV